MPSVQLCYMLTHHQERVTLGLDGVALMLQLCAGALQNLQEEWQQQR